MNRSQTICLEDLMQGGKPCSNPQITWEAPDCLLVNCVNDNCITVEFLDDCVGAPCITLYIKCDSCDDCGEQVRRICFCEKDSDCEDCQECVGNICQDKCKPGEICIDGNRCGKCRKDADCECNKVCIKDQCQCPVKLPYEGLDGCCYECLNHDDCPDGFKCEDNKCVPEDCKDGVWNPTTKECEECVTNEDCPPNECCTRVEIIADPKDPNQDAFVTVDYVCDCCPGYSRNPQTGVCEEEPECRTNEDCGPCRDCVKGKCKDRICPNGKICIDDECVTECDPDNPCPPGEGCINGRCVPCKELNCGGTGLQCNDAVGCTCDEQNNCVASDCDDSDVSLTWRKVQGTPGNVITPGVPAPSTTGSSSPLGILNFNGAEYRDFQFNLGVTAGLTGTWKLFKDPNATPTTIGSGDSVSFKLSDYPTPAVFGFVVTWTGTGVNAGASATFGCYPDFQALLTDSTPWNIERSSSGTPGSTSGGTPSVLTLCSNNTSFNILSIQKNESFSTGTIEIILGGLHPNGCRIATVSGCGIWNGTATLECGGSTYQVEIEEFYIPLDSCCDPTEDDCGGGGTGSPCENPTVRKIDLGPKDNSTNSGEDEYAIKADFEGAGIPFYVFFFMEKCWSSTDGVAISSSPGDSPFGPSPSELGVIITVNGEGCIRLGYSCEMQLSGCEILQGQLCYEGCNPAEPCSGGYTVNLIDNGDGSYKALPSHTVGTTYSWTLNGSVISTSQTATPTSSGTLAVTITNDRGCTCSDQINVTVESTGCMDINACNYDSSANVPDGNACIYVDPDYDCVLKFQGNIVNPSNIPIRFKVRSTGAQISEGDTLQPGQYVIDTYLNNESEARCSADLTVDECWDCNPSTKDCVQSASGLYSSKVECQEACGCPIRINSASIANCNNDGTVSMLLSVSGSTDGTYTVTVRNAAWTELFKGDSDAPIITTGNFCPQEITVEVGGKGCLKPYTRTYPASFFKACCDCDNSATVSISSYDQQTGRVTALVTPSACSSEKLYKLRLREDGAEIDDTGWFSDGRTIPFPIVLNAGRTLSPTASYSVLLSSTDYCTTALTCPDKIVNFTVSEVECSPQVDLFKAEFAEGVAGNKVRFKIEASGFVPNTNYTWRVYYSPDNEEGQPVSPRCADPFTDFISCETMFSYYERAYTGSFDVTSDENGNISQSVLHPIVLEQNHCFGLRLGSNIEGCMACAETFFQYGVPPQLRTVVLDDCTYSELTGLLTINWSSDNLNDNGVHVVVQQSSGATADPCADHVLFENNYPGQDGTQEFEIPQLNGQDTQVGVTIFDGMNPEGYDECNPDGAYDYCTADIPQCSCDWNIVDVQYANDQLQIELDVNCAPNLNDVEIHFDQWTGQGCTGTETVDALTTIVGITQQQAEGSLIFVPLPSASVERFYKIRLEDATATPGCSAEQCVAIEACDCSFQVTDILFDQATLQVTVTTNISGCTLTDMVFGFADANGVLSVEENSTIPAVAGITQTTWTLTSLPQGGTLGVTVSNANEPTCAGTNTIQVCDVVDALDGDPPQGGFTRETNAVYSSRGALVFEHPGLLSYNWVGTGATGGGAGGGQWTLDYPTSAGQIGTPAQGDGSPFGTLVYITNQNGTVLDNALWTGGSGPNLRTQGLWVDGIDENTGSFSHCLDVPADGTYYVAFSADNAGTLKVNNVTVIDLQNNGEGLSQGQQAPFLYTWLVPIQLSAGNNNIEVDFQNFGATDNAVHFAVYDNTYAEIVGGSALVPLVDTSSAGATFGLTVDQSLNVPGGKKCPPGQPYPVYQVDSNGCILKCTDCEPDNS